MLDQTLCVEHPTMDDLNDVLTMLTANDIADLGEADTSADDLLAVWKGIDLSTDAWVVRDADDLVVGYGVLEDGGDWHMDADVYTHPAHKGRGIGTHLISLAEERAIEATITAPPGAAPVIRTIVTTTDEAAANLLIGRGFAVERHFWRMLIELTAPPPAPVWPWGIVVRPFDPAQEDRAVFELVQDAFSDLAGKVSQPFEPWHEHLISRDDFDPSLWFVALQGEELVGATLCYHYVGKFGWVRQLAVSGPLRRKGLGLALLLHAFGEFYRRGEPRIGLRVDSANATGATHLYERAGMHKQAQYDRYQKDLPAAGATLD